ncbi:MAG: hypothetical protein CM1200mP20_11110 [Pseudomonadota bacterium]|nr:MAG: hypothetical protein CM1200mP20_11110 [Pseudomonadota bacterium]
MGEMNQTIGFKHINHTLGIPPGRGEVMDRVIRFMAGCGRLTGLSVSRKDC